MKHIKIYIVGCSSSFRDTLRLLFNDLADLKVVGESLSGRDCLTKINSEVDVVLMDVNLAEIHSVETSRHLLKKYPGIKVLALSDRIKTLEYYQMMHVGAHGFVLKSHAQRDIYSAIQTIAGGSNYFSKELQKQISIELAQSVKENTCHSDLAKAIEESEIEVLRRICRGKNTEEIASELELSVNTISQFQQSLLVKMKSKNTAELIMSAIECQYEQ